MILVFHTAVHTAENYYRMGAWVHSVFSPFLVLFIWLEKSEPLKRAFSPNNNRRSFHSVQKVCVTHMMRPTGFELFYHFPRFSRFYTGILKMTGMLENNVITWVWPSFLPENMDSFRNIL